MVFLSSESCMVYQAAKSCAQPVNSSFRADSDRGFTMQRILQSRPLHHRRHQILPFQMLVMRRKTMWRRLHSEALGCLSTKPLMRVPPFALLKKCE